MVTARPLRCLTGLLATLALPGCASLDSTVSRAGGLGGNSPADESSSPSADLARRSGDSQSGSQDMSREELIQSGMLNVLTRLDATLAKVETTINTKVNVSPKVGGEGDNITTWILALSWVLYPLVWRPARQYLQRRNGKVELPPDMNSTLPI